MATDSEVLVSVRAKQLDTIAAVLPIDRRDELAELLTSHLLFEMGTTEPRTVLFAFLKLASIRLMLRRLCSK